MHELSVASAVLDTALRHADGRAVDVVAMSVGTLRQVVPRSLLFYWDIVARDTLCADARLEITEVDTRLRCTACDTDWEPAEPAFRCPRCASADVVVVAGNELEVEYIEMKEPVHA